MKKDINNTEDSQSNAIKVEKLKIIDNENKLIKINLCYLIVSIVITLISFFIILPIDEKYYAFCEGIPMTLKGRTIVFIINTPTLLVCTVYFRKNFKCFKYFNFLNYPLIILNIFMLIIPIISSVVGSGTILIILIFPALAFIMYLLLSIVCELQLDIRSWKRYLKLRKN